MKDLLWKKCLLISRVISREARWQEGSQEIGCITLYQRKNQGRKLVPAVQLLSNVGKRAGIGWKIFEVAEQSQEASASYRLQQWR